MSQWTPELDEHAPAMLRFKVRGDQALHAKPCRWREAEVAYNTGLQTFAASVPEKNFSRVPKAKHPNRRGATHATAPPQPHARTRRAVK